MKKKKIENLIRQRRRDAIKRSDDILLKQIEQKPSLPKSHIGSFILALIILLSVFAFILFKVITEDPTPTIVRPVYEITNEITQNDIVKENTVVKNISNNYELVPEAQAKCTRIDIIGEDKKTYELICEEYR